jgi:hypothetical protein
MKAKFLVLLTALVMLIGFIGSSYAQVPEQNVLVVCVRGGSDYNSDCLNLYQTVANTGAIATHQDLSSDGQVSALLNSNNYDQIWVFDLSPGVNNYPSDWQAIADWYNAKPDMEIICDGRIISSYWQGRYLLEGQGLTDNYYYNLKVRGGGLVLGTDHDAYVSGINTINSLIGLNPFFGTFFLNFIPVDIANPLMNTPVDLGTELHDNSSPSQTPYGLQPGGQLLYTVAWHSGNEDTPGISSTIEGGIGLHVEITSPPDASQFCNDETITLEAEATGGEPPYTFQWSSDIDGPLGSGSVLMLNAGTLSDGLHTVTVLTQDILPRTDDDELTIEIVSCAKPELESSLVPTMNEWGMIIFMVLAGIGSIYYLRRKRIG